MWILLLIIHLIGNTVYNVELRRASFGGKVDSLFLVAVMSTAIAIPAIPGIIVTGIDVSMFDGKLLLIYVGAIAMLLVFHLLNVKALEHTEASLYTFLYNLRICFATVLAITVLGEAIMPLRIIGGVIVFASAILLVGRFNTGARGIFYSIMTGVAVAFLNLFDKYLIMEIGYLNYMFSTSIVMLVLIWSIIFIRSLMRKRAGAVPLNWSLFKSRSGIVLMFTRCLSSYGFTAALAAGGILSTSTYISSLSFITTMVCGIVFLKERTSLVRKVMAAGIALVGVTFIYLAS